MKNGSYKRMKTIEQMMNRCMLCPRACAADRSRGQRGICGQTETVRAARAGLHMWEEPCISGSRGSGAVFFSGCNLHCVFCQNHSIASGDAGYAVSIERLAEIFLNLQEEGANNLNLVTACQFVPQVIAALERARIQGLRLPVVYNTSGYEAVETIRMLDGYVDIYLPDLKYVDETYALKYSHAADYFEKASAAIGEMVRQTGEMTFTDEKTGLERLTTAEYQERSGQGESLLMTRGVIVRHLLLPGCLEDSKRVIAYLLETYGERIFISMMNQYTPLPHAAAYPELQRRVDSKEYEELIAYAVSLGIENGFIQEGETAQESFIPEFDGRGIMERKDGREKS